MDSTRRIFEEISREIMKRPIISDPYAIPQLHIPVTSASCPTAKDLLSHIKRENERLKDVEREKLAKKLGRENIFRFGYVPLVISELAWDYADTIVDLAEEFSSCGIRKRCRSIKELRSDFLRYRNRYIDAEHHDCEIENMYTFEKCVGDIFRTFIINLKCDLIRAQPDISAEKIMYITAIYQCDVVIGALLRYANKQSGKVTKIVGHTIGNIIPRQVLRLADIIKEFVRDYPVSQEFDNTRETYTNTLATQIGLIGISPINDK